MVGGYRFRLCPLYGNDALTRLYASRSSSLLRPRQRRRDSVTPVSRPRRTLIENKQKLLEHYSLRFSSIIILCVFPYSDSDNNSGAASRQRRRHDVLRPPSPQALALRRRVQRMQVHQSGGRRRKRQNDPVLAAGVVYEPVVRTRDLRLSQPDNALHRNQPGNVLFRTYL